MFLILIIIFAFKPPLVSSICNFLIYLYKISFSSSNTGTFNIKNIAINKQWQISTDNRVKGIFVLTITPRRYENHTNVTR